LEGGEQRASQKESYQEESRKQKKEVNTSACFRKRDPPANAGGFSFLTLRKILDNGNIGSNNIRIHFDFPRTSP
jgi:hypothetical protein